MTHRLSLSTAGLLAAFALVFTLLAARPAAAATCRGASASAARMTVVQTRSVTFCLLNRIRRQHGLAPFRANLKLRGAARGHSLSMVRSRYFAHGNFIGRIISSGFTAGASSWSVGENIAWGGGYRSTPSRIVSGWMHSPPHRANILNGRFRNIGVGVARGTPAGGRGGTYTTDFGSRG